MEPLLLTVICGHALASLVIEKDHRQLFIESALHSFLFDECRFRLARGEGHFPDFCMRVCQRGLRNHTLSLPIFLKKTPFLLQYFGEDKERKKMLISFLTSVGVD